MILVSQTMLQRINSLMKDPMKQYKGTYCELFLSRNDIDIIELHGHRVHYRHCDIFPYYIEFFAL